MIGMWTCALLALALSPAPRPAITPYQYADGGPPPGAKLSPYVVRLRSAALRKPSRRLNATAIAPARRAARLVRVSLEKELTPSQANDLVYSIPNFKYSGSWRKLRVAVALTHAFADSGVIIRLGTFAKLVGACRRAGMLDEAQSLIARVHASARHLNPTVYSALMSDFCDANQPTKALTVYEQMRSAGAVPSNRTLAVLLSSLLRAGAVDAALTLAHELREDTDAAPYYDLPLYNTILQALLAGGADEAVREVLEQLRSHGLEPSGYTLNILLKGFSHGTSLEAALEVFNAYCSAGGQPNVISYNILLAGFAKEGQLLNCEVLFAQLKEQATEGEEEEDEEAAEDQEEEEEEEEAATGLLLAPRRKFKLVRRVPPKTQAVDDKAAAAEKAAAAKPDTYTYNAMILACINSNRPLRALAYYRTMAAQGIAASHVTIGLLADAYIANNQPLNAVATARRLLDNGELQYLNIQCCCRLIAACAAAASARQGGGRWEAAMGATERAAVERAEAAMAAAGMKAVAPAARAALLWTLRRMVEAANAEDAKDGKGRRGRSAAPEKVQPQPQGGGDAESVEALLSLGERAPWSRKPKAVRDMIRTLGHAGDFEGARTVFENMPTPRPPVVWNEMLAQCNACGEPAFASALLAEVAGGGLGPLGSAVKVEE